MAKTSKSASLEADKKSSKKRKLSDVPDTVAQQEVDDKAARKKAKKAKKEAVAEAEAVEEPVVDKKDKKEKKDKKSKKSKKSKSKAESEPEPAEEEQDAETATKKPSKKEKKSKKAKKEQTEESSADDEVKGEEDLQMEDAAEPADESAEGPARREKFICFIGTFCPPWPPDLPAPLPYFYVKETPPDLTVRRNDQQATSPSPPPRPTWRSTSRRCSRPRCACSPSGTTRASPAA